MRKIWLILGLTLVLALAAFAIYSRRAVAPTEEPSAITLVPASGSEVDDLKDKLIIGDLEAKLTLVDYGDFQCPICKRFFEQTEPQLLRDYVDTGKIKIEFRVEAHLGEKSVRAGEAAYCANDLGQFKAYHDELFHRQGVVSFTDQTLKQFAANLKLDQAAFDTCLDNRKHRATVLASHEAAQSRINGTPTFYISEQKIVGAQPYSVFKAIIDAELAKIK
jgi:protein-disulfide isomerase